MRPKENKVEKSEVENYICVESNDPFTIGVGCKNGQDTNTYGAVLYLDGVRVKGKKTFCKRTMFLGFKEGDGHYRKFIFNTSSSGML